MTTAVVVSLFASSTTIAVTADAQTKINTGISRVVLGIGSDATEANVAWQSKQTGTQFLEYWPANEATNVTSVESPQGPYNAAIFYPHEATMTGLKPNTEYVYRVGNERRGWSSERTFTTGAESDTWNFLAMADAQIGVGARIKEQAAAWNKAVNVATGEHPGSAFIMHLGDQAEGWGAPVAQLEAFTAPEKLQNYRLAVLKGNHETYAPERHFQDTYFLPMKSMTPPTTSSTTATYCSSASTEIAPGMRKSSSTRRSSKTPSRTTASKLTGSSSASTTHRSLRARTTPMTTLSPCAKS